MRRVTCVVGSGPRSRITTRAGGARAGLPQDLPCWMAAGGWSKVRPQPAGQGKRPMSARYVSAARRRRRRCVVAGLPTRGSALKQGSAPGPAQTDAAAAEGSAPGLAERALPGALQGLAAAETQRKRSTPWRVDRCGLEGSPASAGGGARRSDLRWLSLLNFGSSFATWGSQVRRPPSPPPGDPSAGPTATKTRPYTIMYLFVILDSPGLGGRTKGLNLLQRAAQRPRSPKDDVARGIG